MRAPWWWPALEGNPAGFVAVFGTDGQNIQQWRGRASVFQTYGKGSVMEGMTLRERLRRIVDALPPGASVTLPRDELAEWIGASEPAPLTDLTVPEVAEIVGRAVSTVRGWCQDGELRAYRFNGREWRITREALREFQRQQAEPPPASGDDDLSSWRR